MATFKQRLCDDQCVAAAAWGTDAIASLHVTRVTHVTPFAYTGSRARVMGVHWQLKSHGSLRSQLVSPDPYFSTGPALAFSFPAERSQDGGDPALIDGAEPVDFLEVER
jgi:hypothetical protein